MTDDMRAAWIEACAKAICRQADADDGYAPSKTLDRSIEQGMWRNHAKQATAALSVLTPLIEAETAERCTRIVGRVLGETTAYALHVNAAIRNAFPAKGE